MALVSFSFPLQVSPECLPLPLNVEEDVGAEPSVSLPEDYEVVEEKGQGEHWKEARIQEVGRTALRIFEVWNYFIVIGTENKRTSSL